MIAYNDAFVMSAWSKANGIKNDDIVRLSFPTFDLVQLGRFEDKMGKMVGLWNDGMMANWIQLFLSDAGTAFSKKLGDWTLGERTARYALVIDHGKIVYAEKEPGREVTVSSAEAVLAKL